MDLYFPGRDIQGAGAPTNGTTAVQTITITSFGACTLSLNFEGAKTSVTFAGSEINSAISAAILAAAIALKTVGTGNVTVATTGTTDRAIAITFAGSLTVQLVPLFTASLAGGAAINATLTTSVAANANLKFTAVGSGTGGNAITIAYVDPSANNHALTVSVTGNAITVTSATGSGGALTSTGSTVLAAILASGPASALVGAALATGNSGAGVITAMSATNLTGGLAAPAVAVANTTPGVTATGKGSDALVGRQYIDVTNGIPYINQGTQLAPAWVKVSAT